MVQNLGIFIKKAAEKYQDKTAFQIKRGIRKDRFSFSQMYDLTTKLASFLEKEGIKKGDKVVILAPNMPEYVLVFFSSWLLGAVPVPIDLRTKKETIEKFAALTQPKIGFTSKYLPHPFEDFDFKTYFLENIIDQIGALSPAEPANVKPSDIAEIVFTSGTTGTPKGTVLTHRNLLFDIEKVLEVFPLQSSWRILSVLPLSHIFAQVVDLLACFTNGLKVIYLPRINNLVLMKTLKKEKITCMATVPQALSLMLGSIKRKAKEKGKLSQFELAQKIAPYLPIFLKRFLFKDVHSAFGGNFKFFVCGSAPLDLKVGLAFENMGIKVYEGYGATETTAGLTLNTPGSQKLGSTGKVLPEMEVKIDENGEIWTKGENIAKGYYKNPEKSKEAFFGNWYRTGDIGYLDDESFLYVVGRTAFKIVLSSGRKVYPEDIEKKLKNHPLVKEACVVGVKKEKGEVVHAVIISDEPKKLKEIIDEVNKNLEDYQKILEFTAWPKEDFPRTPILKIDRKKVLEEIQNLEYRSQEPGARREKFKETRDEVIEILSEVSEISAEKIKENNNLRVDLKIDSLARIELVSLIEENLGVTIKEQKISSETKVADLRKLIKEGKEVEIQEVSLWPFKKSIINLREILQSFLVFPLHHFFVKIKIKNRENLKQIKPPAIFIFNHLGPYDVFCLPRILPRLLRKKLVVLADTKFWKDWFGIKGFSIQLVNAALGISHDQKVNRAGLENAGDLVAEGFSIVISPEGIFSKTGELGEFKPGAGMLAVELKLPVIPIKINRNYQEVFQPAPFGRWQNYLPNKRGKVLVTIGKPMCFSKNIPYIEAAQKMKEEMERL